MTLIVQSVNTIGAGTRIALTTQSDTLNVIRGVSVVTTDDNPAIACSVASSSDVLQIAGQVSGSYGVDFTGASGGASLLVGSAGSLTGDAGDGVNLAGYGTITNYGQIDGSGNGVEANDLTLYNYGSVSFEKAIRRSLFLVHLISITMDRSEKFTLSRQVSRILCIIMEQ